MWPRRRRPGAFAPGQQFGEGPVRHEDRPGCDAPQDPDGLPSLHGLPYPSLQGGWAANVSLHRKERVVRMPNLTRRQVLRTTGVASRGLIAGSAAGRANGQAGVGGENEFMPRSGEPPRSLAEAVEVCAGA